MKDAVGTEIEVGDKIFYSCIRGHSHIMTVNEVAGFTTKMVKTTKIDKWTERNVLVNPMNCVVYETKDGKKVK